MNWEQDRKRRFINERYMLSKYPDREFHDHMQIDSDFLNRTNDVKSKSVFSLMLSCCVFQDRVDVIDHDRVQLNTQSAKLTYLHKCAVRSRETKNQR